MFYLLVLCSSFRCCVCLFFTLTLSLPLSIVLYHRFVQKPFTHSLLKHFSLQIRIQINYLLFTLAFCAVNLNGVLLFFFHIHFVVLPGALDVCTFLPSRAKIELWKNVYGPIFYLGIPFDCDTACNWMNNNKKQKKTTKNNKTTTNTYRNITPMQNPMTLKYGDSNRVQF